MYRVGFYTMWYVCPYLSEMKGLGPLFCTKVYILDVRLKRVRVHSKSVGSGIYVNPQFGTNSFLERGLPDLEFFLAPTHN
jgi:hypothetical protein